MRPAEHGLNIRLGNLSKFCAALKRVHAAVISYSPQQRNGQRPRTYPGLDHSGARENIALDNNLCRVLRVHHGGTARHGQHKILVQRPQRLVLHPVRVGDDRAFGGANQIVMLQKATVRMVLTALSEGDGGDAAALISDLNALAGAKRATSVNGAGGGAHGVCVSW